MKERDHLEGLDVGGKMVANFILKKQSGRVSTGLF